MILTGMGCKVAFCKVSVVVESPIATDAPFSILLYPAMFTASFLLLLNDSCAAFPSVRKIATTAAALNNGISLCVIVMVRAFTFSGSSSLITDSILLSKSLPNTCVLTSFCS